MTYVTCPTMRYHPAVIAQKAATVQLLSGGRFTLGLGAGENLNEHVIGRVPRHCHGGVYSEPEDRSDPDQLGTRHRRRRAARTRTVPLVRRRLARQRQPADHRRLHRSQSVRPTRRHSRRDPVRAGHGGNCRGSHPYWKAGFTDVALVQIGDEGRCCRARSRTLSMSIWEVAASTR
jgi:hypothetical protein